MITQKTKIPKNSLLKMNSILTIFYIILTITSTLDTYFLIDYIKENFKISKYLLITLIIFLVIYPLSLLFNSYLNYSNFIKNQNFEYQQINENLEIINSDKNYEADFRYIYDKDMENFLLKFLIIFFNWILSYSKLIIFHIVINSWRNSSKFSYFLSLKFSMLKIFSLLILLQSFPFFIIRSLFKFIYKDKNNTNFEDFLGLLREFSNINFFVLFGFFLIYLILYKIYFKKFELICIVDNIYERKITNATEGTINSRNYIVSEEERDVVNVPIGNNRRITVNDTNAFKNFVRSFDHRNTL